MNITPKHGYIGFTRDYKTPTRLQMTTGIYRGHEHGLAYFTAQIRGIGRFEIIFATSRKGWGWN